MRFSNSLNVAALFVLTQALGCGADGGSTNGSSSGEIASPIVHGMPDSGAHPAVVAILASFQGGGTECSGTIFKIDVANDVGYVLTAAHCVLPGDGLPAPSIANMSVVTGDNYQTGVGANYHAVLDYASQPGADPPMYDLALVKFKGVTAGMPTLPLTTPDLDKDLADGQLVDIVGFGNTISPTAGSTSIKRRVDVNLGAAGNLPAVGAQVLAFPVGPDGEDVCEGDSGGPWLRMIGTQEYIIAVSSETIGSCDGGGIGTRVASALDNFINPYVNGQPVVEQCDLCTSDSETKDCSAAATACQHQVACYELVNQCGCAINDASCIASCESAHSAGMPAYQALVACFCQASVCGPFCATSTCQGMSGAGGTGGAGGSGGSGGNAGTGDTGGTNDMGGAGGIAGQAGEAGSGGDVGTAGKSMAGASGSAAAGSVGTAGAAQAGASSSAGSGGAAPAAGAGGVASSGAGGAAGTVSVTPAAASPAPTDSGGCGCTVPGKDPLKGEHAAALTLALAALAAARRKRIDRR